MERSIGLSFTTYTFGTIPAPLAHAAPLQQAVQPERTASPFELATAIVTTSAGVHPGGADRHLALAAGSGMSGDCMAAGGLPSSATALALLGVLRRRRR